jgi:hypothetical protein
VHPLVQRWEAREPRAEDVAKIEELERLVMQKEEALSDAEQRMTQLRREMLLREENYNKHFRNGGVGERVLGVESAIGAHQEVVDWMLKAKRRTSGAEHGTGSSSFKAR